MHFLLSLLFIVLVTANPPGDGEFEDSESVPQTREFPLASDRAGIKSSNNRIVRFFPDESGTRIVTMPRQTTGGSFEESKPLALVRTFNERGGPIFRASSSMDFRSPSDVRTTSLFESDRPPSILTGTFNTARRTSFDADINDPNPEINTSESHSFSPTIPTGAMIGTPSAKTRPPVFSSLDSATDDGTSPSSVNLADRNDGLVSSSSHIGTSSGSHLLAGPVLNDKFGSFSRSATSVAASTFESKGMDSTKKMSTAVHESPMDDLTKRTQETRHRAEDQSRSSSFVDDTPFSHKKFESSGSSSAWRTHRSRHRITMPTDDTRVFRLGTGTGKTETFGRTSSATFLGTDAPIIDGKQTGNTDEFTSRFVDFDPSHFRTSRNSQNMFWWLQ